MSINMSLVDCNKLYFMSYVSYKLMCYVTDYLSTLFHSQHSNYGNTAFYPSTYQNFHNQQQQHSRPPVPGKRGHSGFLGSSGNAYTSQSNQSMRRSQQHYRFQHY